MSRVNFENIGVNIIELLQDFMLSRIPVSVLLNHLEGMFHGSLKKELHAIFLE
jgi:hypothetical protein